MFHSSLWKGNIRELANIIERGVLLAENATVNMDSVCAGSFAVPQVDHGKSARLLSLKSVVEDAERNAILKTLKATDNNRSEAARLLGISRRALYDKLAAYSLNP
jgi:DNA-binding NtrC family response regulator